MTKGSTNGTTRTTMVERICETNVKNPMD